jgi:multicomponent Na+:H+ antiporter subunit A
VVTMYGLGGPYGAGGAAFYVIAHAIAKSALFLTAGTVTEATGQDRLSKLGGYACRCLCWRWHRGSPGPHSLRFP